MQVSVRGATFCRIKFFIRLPAVNPLAFLGNAYLAPAYEKF